MDREDWIMLGVVAFLILLCVGLFSLAIWAAYEIEEEAAEECTSLCKSYDSVMTSADEGFFSEEQCWCRTKDNKPLRAK